MECHSIQFGAKTQTLALHRFQTQGMMSPKSAISMVDFILIKIKVKFFNYTFFKYVCFVFR